MQSQTMIETAANIVTPKLTPTQMSHLLSRGITTTVGDFAHVHFSGVSYSWRKPQPKKESLITIRKPQPKKTKNVNKGNKLPVIKVTKDYAEWDLRTLTMFDEPKKVVDCVAPYVHIRRPTFRATFSLETRLCNEDPYDELILYIWEKHQHAIRLFRIDSGHSRFLQANRNKAQHALNGNIDSCSECYDIFNKLCDEYNVKDDIHFTGNKCYLITIDICQHEKFHGFSLEYQKCSFCNLDIELFGIHVPAKMMGRDDSGRQSLLSLKAPWYEFLRKQLVGGRDFYYGIKLVNTIFLHEDSSSSDSDQDIPDMHIDKSNSKTCKKDSSQRNNRLMQKDNELAKQIYHRSQKQLKIRRQKANDKHVMSQLHSFVDVHNHVNFDVSAKIQEMIDNLPEEYRQVVRWADVAAALHVMWTNEEWSARYLAIRTLYSEFKIKGLTIAAFVSACVKVIIWAMPSKNPTIHSDLEMHISKRDSEMSPITVFITLIISILTGQSAKPTAASSVLNAIGHLSTRSRGIDLLIDATKGCVDYVRGVSDPSIDIGDEITKLENQTKEYLTAAGSQRIDLDPSAFTEIATMQMKCVDLIKYVSPSSIDRARMGAISYNVNQLYRRVQLTPRAGHAYRKRPVVLRFFGAPGIGKTYLINLVSCDAISTILMLDGVKGAELEDGCRNYEQYVFFKAQGSKYETGYNTTKSLIYVWDDANQISPAINQENSLFPMSIIHMNNSHDLTLNVAEVDNKKNAKFNSRLIIATDNQETPSLWYLASQDAYHRRLDMDYLVTVKPKYLKTEPVTTNGKYISVVDPTKLDGCVNTHIYNFECKKTGAVMDYEGMIKHLRQKLTEVDDDFRRSVKSFKDYSIERLSTVLKEMEDANIQVDPVFSNIVGMEKQPEPSTSGIRDSSGCHIPTLDSDNTGFNHANLKPISVFLDDPIVEDPIQPYESITEKMKRHFSMFLVWSKLYVFTAWFKKKPKANSAYIFASALGVILGGYGLYKWYKHVNTDKKKFRHNADQQVYNPGDASTAKDNTKPPPKSTPIHTTPMFKSLTTENQIVRREMTTFANAPDAQLSSDRAYSMAKKLCSNSYHIQFCFVGPDGNGILASALNGFFIRGGLFLCNRHLFESIPSYDVYKNGYFNLFSVFQQKRRIPASKVGVFQFRYEGNDTNFYDVVCLDFGTNKQISDHCDLIKFSEREEEKNFFQAGEFNELLGEKVMICVPTINGQWKKDGNEDIFSGKIAWYMEMQHTKVTKCLEGAMVANGAVGPITSFNTIQYPMQSVHGYCGSVVLSNSSNHGGRILGIHMAGFAQNDVSYAQFISAEMIKSLNAELHVSFTHYFGDHKTILDDTFKRIGTIERPIYTNAKSNIAPSLFHNEISITTKAPANLGFTSEGEHVVNKALKKYMTPSTGFTEEQNAIVFAHLRTRFRPTRGVKELDHKTAISGIEGHAYIRGINRKSSAGYPYVHHTTRKGKKDFLGEFEEWKYDHPLVLTMIEDYKYHVKMNMRPQCLFISTAKDELRIIEKVKANKTRSFAAAPLHYVIMFRQCYLDLFSNIMENRVHNGSLVGINPYSNEWDYLVMQFQSIASPYSNQFIAGDYSNFDGTLGTDILWTIHQYIEHIYQRNPENAALSTMLWRDLTSSFQVFGNTIIQMMRGQPSGNPGTAIVNTLFNSSIVFLALHELLEEKGTVDAYIIQENLGKHYFGAFYGDDNVIAFSEKLCEVMHPADLQRKLLDYGLTYTTDLKDDTAFAYRKLTEVTILKRGFAPDVHTRSWMAPLELASILEPLNWEKCDHTDRDKRKLQMQYNSRLAIRELSLHEEHVFQKYVPLIVKCCDEYDIELTADCFYPQKTLRRMLKRGDNLMLLSDDVSYTVTLNGHDNNLEKYDWCASKHAIENKQGSDIYHGKRPESSPLEAFHQKGLDKFYPTVHGIKRIATTTEEQNVLSAHSQEAETVGQIPFSDLTEESTTGQQIVSFSTQLAPIVSTLPEVQELPQNAMANMMENRDHSIKDVICREYRFDSFEVPIGGTGGEILKRWDVLSLLTAQPNIADKLKGFTFLRTDVYIRLEIAVQPFVSGGLMLTLFPDITSEAVDHRLARSQLSTAPNLQISNPSSQTMQIRIPFVSPFLARNLISKNGNIGTVVLSRLTASTQAPFNITAYISADVDTVKVEYPTIVSPPVGIIELENRIKQLTVSLQGLRELEAIYDSTLPDMHGDRESSKIKKSGAISGILNTAGKVATVASGIPVIGSVASTIAPFLKIGGSILGALGLSKPPDDKPITAVKWKPGDCHLSSQGTLPSHVFTMDQGCGVDTVPGEFGSMMDEMSIEAICRINSIISDFDWTTSDVTGKILWKAPCTISQAIIQGEDVYMSPQMWVASLMQNWLASLIFDFDVYGTHFHKGKLRFIYAPMDSGTYSVGSVMPEAVINLGTAAVVEFSGDHVNHSQRIDPATETNLKYVPTPVEYGNNSTIANFLGTQYTPACNFGTLYVLVEVPLQATPTVTDKINVVVSFSATDVKLSNPCTALNWVPQLHAELPDLHADTSTLGTQFNKYARSERMEMYPSMVKGNSAPIDDLTNMKLTVGDEFNHLNKLLNAYTVFSPTLKVPSKGLLRVAPFAFRTLEDTTYDNIDLVDYLACGYAFYKGGMNIRMVGRTGNMDGEAYISTTFGNQGPSGIPTTGWMIYGANLNLPRAGSRTVPVFEQERSIDFLIPYYQGFHMARTVPTTDVYAAAYSRGTLPTLFTYTPFYSPDVRLYRSTGEDFKFGYICGLPKFKLVNARVQTLATPAFSPEEEGLI